MKINFKKVATLLGSALMVGSTVGLAAAASYPAPFVSSGAAIVYGANAVNTDVAATAKISADLTAELAAQTVGNSGAAVAAGDVKVTDDEVTLGGVITGDDIDTSLQDNKLSTLADDKLTWDDGTSSEEYDYHEAIVIGTSNVLTTVDDKKLTGVALSNENALSYRWVFEEAINTTAVGDSEADTLYLTIMGQEYEIEAMTASSITVTTSQEVSMSIGDEKTVAGKQVKLVDVFDGDVEVEVDGKSEVIAEGQTERINGIRVHVQSVGYHSNSPETSKAILKIGEDISKTYSDGDEYIGQDEDDPLWVWDIVTAGAANGYIGVAYNAKIDSANDDIAGDSIKYVGGGYLFPNDYVAVTLDSITEASYEDVKVYFEESQDLFAASDSSTAIGEDKPVLIIEAESTDTITVAGQDTDKVAVWFNATSGMFETYYSDFDGDYTPTNKYRLANASATAAVGGAGNNTLAQTNIASIEVGDTDLNIAVKVVSGVASLIVLNTETGFTTTSVLNLTIGGTAVTNVTGTLEQLGTNDEDSDANDIIFANTDVSTEDYDYMDHYGIKLSDGTTVQAEADDDMATLSIPDEQVYAQVTVSMGATVEDGEDSSVGFASFKDNEVSSYAGKNLIVVGGSCINTVAAELLGSSTPLCESAFTTATTVKSGEFLIQSFTRGSNIALLVAGYSAADTERAVNYLVNTADISTTAGSKIVKTSSNYANVA